MAGTSCGDPFLWDVDRVCKELCFDGAEWTSDASALESRLRENLMDGRSLLTYELLLDGREGLMKCLEVVAARHRIKLARKIISLQSQSPGFTEEKAAIEAELSPSVPERGLIHLTSPQQQQKTTPAVHLPKEQSQATEEHPTKRRRLAPTPISNVESGSSSLRMPGFEEPEQHVIPKPKVPIASSLTEDLPTAYLGEKVLDETSIVPLDADYESSDSGSDTFQSIANPFQPRGRTKAIYSMVKKYLLKNNKKVSKLQTGAGPSSEEADGIIDFDDLASLDEETLREIAAEKEEVKLANSSNLDAEAIERIINEEIAKIKTDWEEKKRPKYERKAYRLWRHAKKHGFLRQQEFHARQQAEHYRNRLSTLTRDFRFLPWKTEEELRFQTHSVEQTVNDKLHQEWLRNLFSLRTAPPMPEPLPRQKSKIPRAKLFTHNDELLSSSDESDNFIVPDEETEPARAASVIFQRGTSPQPSNERSPTAASVNGSRKPHPAANAPPESQADSVIDLTCHSDADMDRAERRIVARPFEPFTQDLLAEIGNVSPKIWAKENDRFRLVISMLWRLTFERREAIFHLLAPAQPNILQMFKNVIKKASSQLDSVAKEAEMDTDLDLAVVHMSFIKCKYYKAQKFAKLNKRELEKLKASKVSFTTLCAFLFTIKGAFPQKNQIAHLDAYDAELLEPDELASTKSASAKKNKKKEIVLDRSAVALRERETKLMEEQEERRKELRANMQVNTANGVMPGASPRLIINESKTADQGFIYVNREIAPRIKDHQIEGVRFLWNNIVREADVRQGCLLAHTMGLGKTMQTITFLVALRESATSPDPSVQRQIPRDLRNWKVLVLCPAGLVENWKDEFLIWAPKGLLGLLITIEAAHTPYERLENAKRWAADGGILLIGYNMFKSGFGKGDETAVTIDKILVDKATIVIADEAHVLKNPKAKIARLASQLKTSTRIALTGSPLANNVEEYYSMINWVAPNFLGPLEEFREMYANPIHQGLYHESTSYEKRKALKMLQVLKETAAPKVHRATIKSCMKDDLPPKEEFVISVPPTGMQHQLYDMYLSAVSTAVDNISQASVFSVLNQLALICAHPAAYRRRVADLNSKHQLGQAITEFPMQTIPQILKITTEATINKTELSYKVELLNKILNQSRKIGDKVLVFSQSLLTLDCLERLFRQQGRRFCRLDGSTVIAKRQDMIKGFNEGDKEVYLISTTAGGVGLNIHGANRVVIFDFRWNPVQDQQAIGRAYRIGQKKPVFVYRFVVAGTFEDDLQNKAVFKMQLASRVVDQKNPVSWSKRLQTLVHPIRHVDASNKRFDFKGKDAVLDHLLDHDGKQAILSVMSSDTFEEEDETATLTAEERQETQSMVERHHLRVADPAEYSRLMEAERLANNHRPSSNLASSKPNKDVFPERPAHAFAPSILPEATTPTTTSVPGGFGTGASAPRGPLPLSNPTPVLGANTYFGNSNAVSSNGSVVPSDGYGASSPAPTQTPRWKFEHKLLKALAQLREKFPLLFSLDVSLQTSSLCRDIEKLRQDAQTTSASDMVRWAVLVENLGHDKFVLAIAGRQVSARFLALADGQELNDRLLSLASLPQEFLLRNLVTGGREEDPEVCGEIKEPPNRQD